MKYVCIKVKFRNIIYKGWAKVKRMCAFLAVALGFCEPSFFLAIYLLGEKMQKIT